MPKNIDTGVADFDGVPNDLDGVIINVPNDLRAVLENLFNCVPNDLWTVLEHLSYIDDGVIYDQFDDGVDFDQCVDNGLWRSGYLWDLAPRVWVIAPAMRRIFWVIVPATAFLRSALVCGVICGVYSLSVWRFHLGGVFVGAAYLSIEVVKFTLRETFAQTF